MAMSDAEDSEPSTAPSKRFVSTDNVRVKKRTVLSDDDDDGGVDLPPRRTRKSFKLTDTRDSDEEKNVRALMDMDDGKRFFLFLTCHFVHVTIDQVTRVSREAKEYLKEEEEEESEHDVDQDVEMADIPVLKAKPKKRREKKKVIPLGRNGLKKKRVIKSRQTFDAKGYTGNPFLYTLVYLLIFRCQSRKIIPLMNLLRKKNPSLLPPRNPRRRRNPRRK